MGDTETQIFTCSDCPKTFHKGRDYNRHRKKHDRPYKCLICGDAAFALNTDLKRHRNTHKESRSKLPCPHSGCLYKGATRKDHLVRHRRRVHGWSGNASEENNIRYRQNENGERSDEAAGLFLDLLEAAGQGDEERVKELVSKGAQVTSTSAEGFTPLHLASSNGLVSMVNMLIGMGSPIHHKDKYDKRTALHSAAGNGHVGVVELLLEKGAMVESEGQNGATLLTHAAARGLDNRAEIESQDRWGQTPLSHAAEKGREEVVKLLLEKGADIESKGGWRKQTPLSHAAMWGHEELVKLLLDKGADVESKDGLGQTPLSHAAEKGREEVVKLLLDKGADVESKDKWGRTPLSHAAMWGHEELVKLLLDKGAKVDVVNSQGMTTLISMAHKSVAGLLRSYTQ